MNKRTANILFAVFGVVLFCIVAGVAAGAWFFASVFDSRATDEAGAIRAFGDVRQRFSTIAPVIEIREREMILLRKPPDVAPAKPIRTVHVLIWKPEDENVTQLAIPMWLVRFSDDPIWLRGGSGALDDVNLSMRAEDIERYGPTLIVDHRTDAGEQFLVWTD